VVSTWLVDPGIPIPPEATKVHGVTDEMAAKGLHPQMAVEHITSQLHVLLEQGVPVVGMNCPFDLTLLDREALRHGVAPLVDRLADRPVGPVVDVFVIDKQVDRYRPGSRRLESLCEHYGVPLVGAHDAVADALGAARVAWVLLQRYPELARMPLDELHDAQVAWKREQHASFKRHLEGKGKSTDGLSDEWPLIMKGRPPCPTPPP